MFAFARKITSVFVTCILFILAAITAGRATPTQDFLAYKRLAQEDWHVYVADLSRGVTVNLGDNPPLVFVADYNAENDVYLLDLRGADLDGDLTSLSRSPDGTRLAYLSESDGNRDIYVYDLASHTSVNLTRSEVNEYEPAWTPDGRVSFSIRSATLSYLYTVAPGENLPVRLTADNQEGLNLRWSKSGRGAFYGYSQGSDEIFVVDGGKSVNVSRHPAGDYKPEWLPDGRLAFTSNREGILDVFVLNLETGEVTNVTHAAAPILHSRWSSSGRLVYTTQGAARHMYIREGIGAPARLLTTGMVIDPQWWRWP